MMGLVVSVITIPSDNLRRRGREEGGCDDRERIAVLSARRGCRSKIPHPFGLTLQYHEDDLVGSASMQPPTNDVTYPSLAVWKRALLFHLHNWNNLLLISPLLLLPVVTVAVLFGVVFTSTDLSVVYLLTRGGPYNSTHVLASLAFQRGILGGDLGQGAAIALFLLPALVVVAIVMLRLARRAEVGA